MKIQTLTGHLTATNKAHLRQMLKQNMLTAESPKIRYSLAPGAETGTYRVEISSRESDDWGRMRRVSHFASFRVSGRG